MKKCVIVLLLLIWGINSYGQDRLGGRGMFVLGHFLPGVEQTFTEDRLWLGIPLMAGTVGCVSAVVAEQVKIHKCKIKLDTDPSNSLYYDERISKATKGRNISLICLGVVELANIVTLWTGKNSPIQVAYFPETNAVGVTYALKF